MSFDDYVNHIAQKYCLATAIAVIQSKPDNITLEQYLVTLRNKLNPQNMDTDFDVTISSGDFEFDSLICDVNDSLAAIDVVDHFSDVTNTNAAEFMPDGNPEEINAQNININTPLIDNDSQMTYFEEDQTCRKNGTVKETNTNNETAASGLLHKNEERVGLHKSDYINTNELEETQIYTIPELLEYYTHYSESQSDIMTPVGNVYIINNEKQNIIANEVNSENVSNNYSQNAQDIDLYFDRTQNMDFIFEENLNTLTQNNLIYHSVDKDHNYVNNDLENYKGDSTNEKENQHDSDKISNTANSDNHLNFVNEEEMYENGDNPEIEELRETNAEIVPFKVIEELNKVTMFLKKRDERVLTDSGYRSESQGKNSKTASQLSVSSVNQSANCLLEYIRTCPLISSTREILKEISETLGSLVDKLHEDETYPPFIEVLLESVDISLRQISEGDGSSNNALSIKDDIFQRILLINKSKNIQKYTINNITKYIESVAHELHNTETYEIININTIENLCYILYILEIIITDYNKNGSLPATQTSQDEHKLKRSSLSEMWRRKWNQSCKETKQEVLGKEKCVLEYCSEVLNKLTVGCMESYSLISYSALKCYNLLQTL